MTTKCGKQVHLEDLTQVRLIKQVLVTSTGQDYVTSENYYIFTTTMPMATKLDRMATYLEWLLPINRMTIYSRGLTRSSGKLKSYSLS